MKKNLIIGVVVVLAVVISMGTIRNNVKKQHKSAKDTIVLVPQDTPVSVKGKKVLYIGDSHTTYAYGWQDRLCRRTGMTYVNTAVGGKMTLWMLDVLRRNINKSFDYCIIWGGANDMAGMIKPVDAVHNIQEMVNLCNENGVKAIVMTGFGPKDCVDVNGQSLAWQKYPPRYEIFQKMLQDSITGATVIKSHFISRKDKDCEDFVCHMKASGHIKMADSMIKRLKFKTIK